MKAEDVMKALELCIASRPKCKDCPYFIEGIRCKHSKLLRDALALLREKDADIERLKGALKAEEQHNEFEMECAKKALAKAKADTVMKMQNRVQAFLTDEETDVIISDGEVFIPISAFRKIAKEMLEES